MRNLTHLLLAGAFALAACNSPINFVSKVDPRFRQPLQIVYLTAEPVNDYEEFTYLRVMADLRKELRARGVLVFVDETEASNGTLLTLRQGATYRRERTGPGNHGHSLGLDGRAGVVHDQFLVVLTDGRTDRDFWVGQIGYQEGHVPFLAKKIVEGMVDDGVVMGR